MFVVPVFLKIKVLVFSTELLNFMALANSTNINLKFCALA